ncbi:hypothetical protein GCM10012284_21410 [Mangrovihabitans endophyticus]|uniref:Uncharacterized protein n=2 Tax=Mangrovihabitans endophyticus TaxID=1751298 RepID=A0A8J3FMU6_9ACTN|nr:hypothetical protein GCM10012284_21410 [Mangrovihabitans endophyticus]
MAALIMVGPGLDWQSSGGLFDFVLEYLIPRVSDAKTAEWLQTVVNENLGSMWIPDLPSEAREDIYRLLQGGLLTHAEKELPEGPAKPDTLATLRDLVQMTRAGNA